MLRITMPNLLIGVALAAITLVGCGAANDGSGRCRLWGTITFDGQPLPSGKISFDPDAEQGNSGPGGYAEIIDGRYDTARGGKGAVPGPIKVRIEGYDGQPSDRNDFNRYGNLVFRVHRDQIEVPNQATEFNFDVPNPPNEK